MALNKKVKAVEIDELELSYHRIYNMMHVVNVQTCINVVSYRNEAAREEEKENPTVFRQCDTFFTDYTPDMTIEQAYEFLKTKDKFKDAEDC